jgi:peptidoglycan/xylan/chitin deacetylase (PgdA/CDA1 family)
VWPDQAKVAVSLVLNYEEGSEHYQYAGDAATDPLAEFNYALDRTYRDFSMESVYEYGSRAGIWRLLRIFDEYGIKVTFFACGMALEANPEVGQAIREAGHEPCSHGYRWSEPWLFSVEEERREIELAVEAIRRTCGERPLGWYWRYSGSVRSRELLVEEGGFLYDSDAYNDDLPYFVQVHGKDHLVIPYTQTYNDFRFVVADGCVAGPNIFSDFCKRALDELRREGAAGYPKMMTIGLHPRLIGQAGRASALREFIEHALARGDVWFARRAEIARWWIDHHHEFER